jgi:hypothetical protein
VSLKHVLDTGCWLNEDIVSDSVRLQPFWLTSGCIQKSSHDLDQPIQATDGWISA